MENNNEIKRFGEHQNAFGFLRLLFASLVIVSHTPELVDGNRSREILTGIFGTVSFGELSVDGFFIISGYLIVGSWLKTPQVFAYLKKRIARLYPAFIFASIICVVVVAPLGGGLDALYNLSTWFDSIGRMITLRAPKVPGSFVLNGAMWTISYEFRCYLLVMVLGLIGILKHRKIVVLLAFTLLAIYASLPIEPPGSESARSGIQLIVGKPHEVIRLISMFFMGSVFYIFRDEIKFTKLRVIISAISLIFCLFIHRLAEPAIATFGSYLIFSFAAWGSRGIVSQINNRNDISYGVYLYAWPIENLLINYFPTTPLLALGIFTLTLSCACGWLSWHYLEKPVMRLLR